MAQSVENLPAKQESQVRSLGWEDPLEEEEIATHSIIPAWGVLWTEEPGGYRPRGCKTWTGLSDETTSRVYVHPSLTIYPAAAPPTL